MSPNPPAKPLDRTQYTKALAANAAAKPFNIVMLIGVMAAGVVLGAPTLLSLGAALAVYVAACTRTFFDTDEADKVLEKEKAGRRKALEGGRERLDPATLAPPIQKYLTQAKEREQRIRDAADSAELPYTEVLDEVDGFILASEDSARKAQLLHDVLDDMPEREIENRLAEARNDPSKAELAEALEEQLAVAGKVRQQLQRFYNEMERLIVDLDTVRGHLASASASTDSANQRQLADEVSGLRKEMSNLAEGMSEAYETTTPG